MIDHATNNVWVSRTGTHGKAIEDRLRALQNRHRLGLHMVENRGMHFTMDPVAYADLDKVDPASIPESLRAGKPWLFSLSLLPACHTGFSVLPYQCEPDPANPDRITNYGYLFDLSQDQPHPPRVVRASSGTIISGSLSPNTKDLRIDRPDDLSAAYTHYLPSKEQIEALPRWEQAHYIAKQWTQSIYADAGNDLTGPAFTNAQLDVLGEYSTAKAATLAERETGRIFPLNEILTATSSKNIAALVVPSYPETPGNHKQYAARIRLQGAVIGLEHLKQGIDLPVMIYHVAPPQQAECSYLGQGKAELMEIGLSALKELGPKGLATLFSHYTQLADSLKAQEDIGKTLGVYLGGRTDGAHGWPAQVDKRLDALKASHAGMIAP